MSLALVVLAHQQFVELLSFGVLEQFYPAYVVGIRHVFVKSAHSVAAVLRLDILAEDVNMPSSFSDEGVPCSLENQTYAEVGIILLFLETCLYQPSLERDIALLLHTELIPHDFQELYLTDNQLLLLQHVLLQVLILLNSPLEGSRYLLTTLNNLLFKQLIFNSGVFVSHE